MQCLHLGHVLTRDHIFVAVDGRQVYRAQRRGTGKNLIDLYGQLAQLRPNWCFVLFHQFDVSVDPLAGFPQLQHRQIDIKGGDRFNLWEQFLLPLAAWTSGATVLHCPANTGPSRPLTPLVLTVHDLIPLEIAPNAPTSRLWMRRVSAAVRKARHIITPSNYSKRLLIEHFGVSSEKITVNPWAPDRKLCRLTDVNELNRVRRKYGLRSNEPYIFAFGAEDPRKNTRLLIEAYAGIVPALRKEHRLLLVGIQEQALLEFRAIADQFGVAGQVVLHGFADEADIPALLSGATVLCFPSRSEGFGLPILDAFVCRTAVLTSNRTSLPEVAGDAAILVNPDSKEAIGDGLETLLSDESLRQKLVARGSERVRQFSWERVAETVAGVFEQVAG